jgi:hypothetical protein
VSAGLAASLIEKLSHRQEAVFTHEPRDLNRQRHERDEVDNTD